MKPSPTALLAAAHRADHFASVKPPILEDNAATWLLEPPLSTVLGSRVLRWLFWRPLLDKVRPVSTWIVVRSRYTEDSLDDFLTQGGYQYVILGAGLDSWAVRHADTATQVYELDLPATQEWKAARIIDRLGTLPENLHLIPVDFEHDSLVDVLPSQGYDLDSPALVSWLGTLCYLSRAAIAETALAIGRVCAPGSQVVCDYFVPKTQMAATDLDLFETLDEGGKRRGEPMQTLLNPGELREMFETAGFRIKEDLCAEEIRQRYLTGRSDHLDIPGFARLCCVERSGRSI